MKYLLMAALTVVASNMFAVPALATKIETTRASVNKECGLKKGGGEKSGCSTRCGDESNCMYDCKKVDKQEKCTVTINRVVPKRPKHHTPTVHHGA